jgi:hypothetical protein
VRRVSAGWTCWTWQCSFHRLSTREHVIALEARDTGILGMLLRYPYEVRSPKDYFESIEKVDTPKEMIDLAGHIIDTISGHFDPKKFDDRYEDAMRELIKKKAGGEKITPVEQAEPKTTTNLMEALRALTSALPLHLSIEGERVQLAAPNPKARHHAKPSEGDTTAPNLLSAYGTQGFILEHVDLDQSIGLGNLGNMFGRGGADMT